MCDPTYVFIEYELYRGRAGDDGLCRHPSSVLIEADDDALIGVIDDWSEPYPLFQHLAGCTLNGPMMPVWSLLR